MAGIADVIRVEVAWASAPWASSPTYTDMTARVQSLTWTRARQGGFGGTVTPGRLTMVLTNQDGEYDPTNTSSGSYANLKPDKVVKVTCSDDGFVSSQTMITAHIDDIGPNYTTHRNTVTVTATENLRLLAMYDIDDLTLAAGFEGDQIDAILTAISWPATYTGQIDRGQVWCHADTLTGQALAVCQDLARTGGGTLYVSRGGLLRYRRRHLHTEESLWNTSQVTLAETGTSGVDVAYRAISGTAGRFRRVTRVVASGYSGRRYTRDNTAANHPPRTRQQTGLRAYFDADADAAAAHWLDTWNYNTGHPTSVDVNIWPGHSDALTMMADNNIDLMHRITVKATPKGHGAQRTWNCVVEGETHTVTPDRWQATLTLGPFDLYPNSTNWAPTSGALTADSVPAY